MIDLGDFILKVWFVHEAGERWIEPAYQLRCFWASVSALLFQAGWFQGLVPFLIQVFHDDSASVECFEGCFWTYFVTEVYISRYKSEIDTKQSRKLVTVYLD